MPSLSARGATPTSNYLVGWSLGHGRGSGSTERSPSVRNMLRPRRPLHASPFGVRTPAEYTAGLGTASLKTRSTGLPLALDASSLSPQYCSDDD